MSTPEQFALPEAESAYNPVFADYLQRLAPKDQEGFVHFMQSYATTELRVVPNGDQVGTLYVREGFDTDTSTYISIDYDDTIAGTLPMRMMRNRELAVYFNRLQIKGTITEQDAFMSAAHNFCSPGGIHNHIDLVYVLAHLTQMLVEARPNSSHGELPIPPGTIAAYLSEINKQPNADGQPFYYRDNQLILTPEFKGEARLNSINGTMRPLLSPSPSHITSAYQVLHNRYKIPAGILSVGHPLVQPYRIYKTFEADEIEPPDIICIAQKHKGEALTAMLQQRACLTNPDLRFVHLDDMAKHLRSLSEAHKALAAHGDKTVFTPMHVVNHDVRPAFATSWQNQLAEMTIRAATPTTGILPSEALTFGAHTGEERIIRTILQTLGYQWDPNIYI